MSRKARRSRVPDREPDIVCVGPGWQPGEGRCGACGGGLRGRQKWMCGPSCETVFARNHFWNDARSAAVRRSPICSRDDCSSTDKLEVNHIFPREGEGYEWGCWHHQTNLQVLCHRHHVEVTNEQRRARKERRGRTVSGYGVVFYRSGRSGPEWLHADAVLHPQPEHAVDAAVRALVAERAAQGTVGPAARYCVYAAVTEVLTAPGGGAPEWRQASRSYRPFAVSVPWNGLADDSPEEKQQ